MGKWWGILVLLVALAALALFLNAVHHRRQAELALPLWRESTRNSDTQVLAVAHSEAETGQSSPAGQGETRPADSIISSAATDVDRSTTSAIDPSVGSDGALPIPILLAVDTVARLAALQSQDRSTHTVAPGAQLPASNWRLQEIGPDFVELSGTNDGNRQRLRLYRQDLQRPYRLISDRITTPPLERMILLPLQPVPVTADPAGEARP